MAEYDNEQAQSSQREPNSPLSRGTQCSLPQAEVTGLQPVAIQSLQFDFVEG